jgi:hypothetical protein
LCNKQNLFQKPTVLLPISRLVPFPIVIDCKVVRPVGLPNLDACAVSCSHYKEMHLLSGIYHEKTGGVSTLNVHLLFKTPGVLATACSLNAWVKCSQSTAVK